MKYTPDLFDKACKPAPAVVRELESGVPLFGGKRKLVERIREESADINVGRLLAKKSTKSLPKER